MLLLTSDFWEIKTTKKTGRGIFVKKDLQAGIVIGDYIGKVLKTAEDDTSEKDEGLYLMYYHDRASIYPKNIQGPGVHLINHSCAPNCWMYIYKGHTLFFTLRHIFAGEELTISYLLSHDPLCHPCTHVCKCDSMVCSHTMHQTKEQFQKWNTFCEIQTKKTKRARIQYGKELAKLAIYPEHIPDNHVYTLTGCTEQSHLSLDNTILPTTNQLRQLIRKTGRILSFPELKTTVYGIRYDEIIYF
jgi:hypothetical protein